MTIKSTPIKSPEEHPVIELAETMPNYSAILIIAPNGGSPIIRDVVLRTGATGFRHAMQSGGQYLSLAQIQTVLEDGINKGYSFEHVEVSR